MQTSAAIEGEDKDLPLREDIRLLGRILGDTIRQQSGEVVYDTVENIRQNSVRFRRDEDLTARRDLEATLNSLKPKDALQIIRAFGFFSHLANIAEDQHHIRRTRAHSLSAAIPREGTMAHSLARTSGRHSGGGARRVFCRRHGGAGFDRASDRSAAQKHDRPRDGSGRADRGTRPVFADSG
jgi:phosphoenolpyruvate carboxylase